MRVEEEFPVSALVCGSSSMRVWRSWLGASNACVEVVL